MFDKFGEIERVQVIVDRPTGRSRGYAFIYYMEVCAAVKAREECIGMELDGRPIRVDFSISYKTANDRKRSHSTSSGSRSASFNRRFRSRTRSRSRS